MDLLFKRYASPFLLLENYISAGRFADFVLEFIEIQNEETLWEFYIHKVHDKSWEDFKRTVDNRRNNVISEEQLETTVQDSKYILNNFIPHE